ncbi:MAG TPA: N-methyl-L-tryptophan oxidase [Candidatus Limnocylindria bacterium]|nr:N-methyl-L-tryptophan oxidase [Candidatus Limnocylindria bacterium]
MIERYDAIVIGLGGHGSAAAYHLARRGRRVLGLEQFAPLHEQGSSHGLTRIIRLAYHEHPSYVPLLRRAYELWHELESVADEELLITTGALEGGPGDGATFRGSLAAAELHDLPHEVLEAADLERRFGFANLDPATRAVLQPDGGFLLAEETMRAHHAAATAHGAELRFEEAVTGWEPIGTDGVRVRTARGSHDADRLVVCAGAWIRELVPSLATLAVPERQVLGWFTPKRDTFGPDGFPVFLIDVEGGRHYYGFPTHAGHGVKLGWYHHFGEVIDPSDADRTPRPDDEAALRHFMERYLPDAAGPTEMLRACIFTNTPDEHFVIDHLADAPQVTVASACSGHGYKFASVIGEILADLAIDGETAHDIGLFRLDRFGSAAG